MRLALSLALVAACGDTTTPPAPPGSEASVRSLGVIDGVCTGEPGKPRVLVYTYENEWRHLSNLYARGAILGMCATRAFNVSSTNDVFAINAHQLAQTDVLVFAVTSGMGLDDAAKADLEAWVRAGGGIVGIHSATSTEFTWPFYVDNIGPQFLTHAGGLLLGTVDIEPVSHPITAGLAPFHLTDEWYVFQSRPEDQPGLTPLLSLDETSVAGYPPDLAQGHHVIAWTTERFGGRVFYIAAGHNTDTYSDPTFLEIIGRAIEWTARQR